MKIIFHIGTEKTGTTSIQSFVWENREYLRDQGIYVPTMFGMNHYELAVFCNMKNTEDLIRNKRIDLSVFNDEFNNKITKIYDEAIRSNSEFILFTNEHLSSRLKKIDHIRKLRNLFPPTDDVKIIVYLRKQSSYLQSLYCEAIKEGCVDKFEDWCVNFKYMELNYDFFLDGWIKAFGRDCVEVRAFNNSLVGNDIVIDFCHALNINTPMKKKRRNMSLNKMQIALIRWLNRVIPLHSNRKKIDLIYCFR